MPIPAIAYVGAGAVGLYLVVKKFLDKGAPQVVAPTGMMVNASTGKADPPVVMAPAAAQDAVSQQNAAAGLSPQQISGEIQSVINTARSLSRAQLLATAQKSPTFNPSDPFDQAGWATDLGVEPGQIDQAAASVGLTTEQFLMIQDPALFKFAFANLGLVLPSLANSSF